MKLLLLFFIIIMKLILGADSPRQFSARLKFYYIANLSPGGSFFRKENSKTWSKI